MPDFIWLWLNGYECWAEWHYAGHWLEWLCGIPGMVV